MLQFERVYSRKHVREREREGERERDREGVIKRQGELWLLSSAAAAATAARLATQTSCCVSLEYRRLINGWMLMNWIHLVCICLHWLAHNTSRLILVIFACSLSLGIKRMSTRICCYFQGVLIMQEVLVVVGLFA